MTDTVVRKVNAPLVPPTAHTGLLGVFKERYLLKLLVRREISARYQGSFLGLIWSYINPLTQLFIYWFVMGKIVGMEDRAENFALHVFSAFVVIHFFTETFGAGTRSIRRNKSLVKKMALPREMFPVASMLVSAFHVVPQLIILTVACVAAGWRPDPIGMIAMVLGMVLVMVFGVASALVFSLANVFFRDFGSVVGIMTNFVRFSAPMIYPYTLVTERFGSFADYYLFNPVCNGVLLMQRAFWVGTTDDVDGTIAVHLPADLLTRGVVMLGIGLVFLAIAQWWFSKYEDRAPDRLS